MAEITRIPVVRHLRSEAGAHIQHFRDGRRTRSGKGLSFWFLRQGASISEIPMDDRDLPFLFNQISADFQAITVQGMIVWRVTDPELLGERIDFTIDLSSGAVAGQPMEQIATLLTGLAQEPASEYFAGLSVREILAAGLRPAQQVIEAGLVDAPLLAGMGLQVAGIRVSGIAPTADLRRALEVPTFEQLQQEADEATFARRAQAVDKERAIAENELQNRIELARRERGLIETEAGNARDKAVAEAAALKISARGSADRLRVVEEARIDTDRARMDIYADLPPSVMIGLALRDFASKLEKVESVTITPDMLGELLRRSGLAGVLHGAESGTGQGG